jgi:hypothetical protein
MPSLKLTACEQCDTLSDLTGRVGRPPHYCSAECRRAGHAAERARRAERREDIRRVRELVYKYEAAVAA